MSFIKCCGSTLDFYILLQITVKAHTKKSSNSHTISLTITSTDFLAISLLITLSRMEELEKLMSLVPVMIDLVAEYEPSTDSKKVSLTLFPNFKIWCF